MNLLVSNDADLHYYVGCLYVCVQYNSPTMQQECDLYVVILHNVNKDW